MQAKVSTDRVSDVEASTTPKREVTPPNAQRNRSKPVLDLEDLWNMADEIARQGRAKQTMTIEKMNEARALRIW
jgi:hypothetical protein